MLEILGLDAGSGVPSGAEYQHDELPTHDTDTQFVTWRRETDENWSLVVVDKPLFARVIDGIVTDTNPAAAYDGVPVDRLTIEQMDEAERWHDVPVNMRRHIRLGWRQVGETFEPPSVADFQAQLRQGAVDSGEESRYAIATPAGYNEVGTWLMNYVGVALHQAGLPTPMWDIAVAIEAAKKGVAVADLKAIHIAKAQNYHAMAGLIQGMVGDAKAAFTVTDQATLIAESDRLRGEAMLAMANPQAAIAAIIGQ